MRARIRAGDQDAFGEAFDQCSSAVFRHAIRVTANWATAEDAVSLTFLEAWRLRERLYEHPMRQQSPDQPVEPDGDHLLPWFLGITTNVLRNMARAARRHRAALARISHQAVTPDFSDQLVGQITGQVQLAAAKAALGRLRRPEREILALCVWSELNYEEVAEALSIPVGTVRSRLSRARAKLRKLTEEELRGKGHQKRLELPTLSGQIPANRIQAVRSIQEMNR
ncbi:MAG: RNA polymerase sigma factor [Dactylosporangium sp.]|nr:RNA polymerase sigma factor [Dactylosporangium sp.]